jgi:hypothetical protein
VTETTDTAATTAATTATAAAGGRARGRRGEEAGDTFRLEHDAGLTGTRRGAIPST